LLRASKTWRVRFVGVAAGGEESLWSVGGEGWGGQNENTCDDRKTPQPSEPRKHNTSMEASRMHILYYTNIRMLAWRKADARPNEPHHHLFTQPS